MAADIDVYVESRRSFRRGGYTANYIVDGLRRRGLAVSVRERAGDGGRAPAALLHVDLTEVPKEILAAAAGYPFVVNGGVPSIRRTLYSAARIGRESGHAGPVIVKTVLNSGGRPEQRHAVERSLPARLAHFGRKLVGGAGGKYPYFPYRVLATPDEVPEEVWDDEALIVERFLPGSLTLPIVKYRYLFCLEAEVNLRGVFDDLLCRGKFIREHGTVPGVPDEVVAVRRSLNLDFGAIDYFMVDGKAIVVDANKTVGTSAQWWQRYAFLRDYVGRAEAALAARLGRPAQQA